MNPFRVISCSLSPNTNRSDIARAFSLFVSSPKDSRGYKKTCEQWFLNRYHPIDFRFFLSGRQAMTALLSTFGIKEGDEVIIQAFTCMVVANAIRHTGATVKYADIDSSYNLTVQSIKKVVTKETKAIIVQHTFSIPADIAAIREYTKKTGIVLIEDLAHGFGTEVDTMPLGSFGDGTVFSFGRDKAVSSVWGGAAMILPSGKNKIKTGLQKMPAESESAGWIKKQLLHPIILTIAIHTYLLGIGKFLIEAAKRMGILSRPVSDDEKQGIYKPMRYYSYPWQLAGLLDLQLKRLPQNIAHRSAIGALYEQAFTIHRSNGASLIPYLRYPVRVQNRDELLRSAKRKGILLGTWYSNVIDPKGSSLTAAGYMHGQCPRAEELAASVCNLPTNVTKHDARRIIEFVLPYIL